MLSMYGGGLLQSKSALFWRHACSDVSEVDCIVVRYALSMPARAVGARYALSMFVLMPCNMPCRWRVKQHVRMLLVQLMYFWLVGARALVVEKYAMKLARLWHQLCSETDCQPDPRL
jgi:hypothetical protein